MYVESPGYMTALVEVAGVIAVLTAEAEEVVEVCAEAENAREIRMRQRVLSCILGMGEVIKTMVVVVMRRRGITSMRRERQWDGGG